MRKAKPAADLTRVDDPMPIKANAYTCPCGKTTGWPSESTNAGCIDHGLQFVPDPCHVMATSKRPESELVGRLIKSRPIDIVDARKERVIKSASQTHEMILDEITAQLVADPTLARYSIGLSTFPTDVVGLVIERMTLDGWEVYFNHEGYLSITLPVVPVLSPLPGVTRQSVVNAL